MKVYITGFGIVSAIGLNTLENLQGLENGKTGIALSSKYNKLLGEVRIDNKTISYNLGIKNDRMSRSSLLGIMAAKEAWGDRRSIETVRTGLVSATSVGGLDKIEELYNITEGNLLSPLYKYMTYDNGGITEEIAQSINVSGFIGTISTACSSGANAIIHGARMIKNGKLDRVITGGVDAIARFDIEGFNALNIYDQEPCKPFDENRKGLNLGEGAAYLILESEYSISQTHNTPICCLSGWDNASDAFHQTASSDKGTGATITMNNALKNAGIPTSAITYINAHGTGTPNNDLSESVAFLNVFGDKVPDFSSTKSYTGHTLAAAGAIEAVYCILAITKNIMPQNLNFNNPMKETGLTPLQITKRDTHVDHVLSNSFGFGGNCSTLIFSKN